jgi:acyl transferase domain-containing protein/acyl carrier protein
MANDPSVSAGEELEGIAIIGMACRFPGAPDLASFWRNLCEGRESVTFFSRAELEAAGVPNSLLDMPSYVPAAPVLDGVEQFDAGFFSYSAREATLMDPQQRLLLETAWECFENAGYRPESLAGPVGVFAGSGGVVTSYLTALQPRSPELWGPTGSLQHIGNDKDFLSTRISFKLDLRGPSVNVQTACSTSLVALHLACRSLLDGECDLALAGAATVRVPHQAGYVYQSEDILSPDGHCRAFDEGAQGTIFGSGVAAVLLKPLRAAVADGDHIHAVVKGSAINNDGAHKVSYTASSVPGQARAMVEAMAMANVSPESIGYVECHATGTTVGDPLEIQALTRAFRTSTDRRQFCGIGSVKSNIGHLEQTAGMAALIKTALALSHKRIPPTINLQKPNPKLGLPSSPFYVQTTLTDWEGGPEPRRAGLNGLGLGGTNAFVVLEEAPEPRSVPTTDVARPAQILALSARSEPALRQSAARLAAHLGANPQLALKDVCFTSSVSRTGFHERLAVSADSLEQLTLRLAAFAEGRAASGVSSGNARGRGLVFLFTGQGAQYPGMSRELYASEPVFREALMRCDELSRPHLERSLLSVLFATDAEAELVNETAYTQICLFAVEYSLFCLWGAWGIHPEVVMGHSVGELVALCVAGCLGLEDALKLVAWRGRLMQGLPRDGGMAAIFASEATVLELLAPFDGRLSLAAVNAPGNVVVSGEQQALRAFLDGLGAREISCKELVVSHAFHSASMDPILEALEQVASELALRPPGLKVVSNLTGELHAAAPAPRYFRDHARGAVRFAHGIEQLHAAGFRRFVEVGPGSSLLALGRQSIGAADIAWLPSLSRKRADFDVMAESLRELFVLGHDVEWSELHRGQGGRRVPLPTYPFQRKRYWVKEGAIRHEPARRGEHPLLGLRRRSTLKEAEFEASYGLSALGYLDDHRIFGLPVLPTTAALEAIATGARQFLGVERARIEQFLYREALVLPEEGTRLIHLVFSPDGEGRAKLRLYSTDEDGSAAWIQHIEAEVVVDVATAAVRHDLAALRASCPRALPIERYYPAIRALGLEYGPAFRGIRELWQGDAQALSHVVLTEDVTSEGYTVHPAFLDACLHIYPALAEAHADFSAPPDEPSRCFLPISLERVQVFQTGRREAWVHAMRRPGASADAMTIDISLHDDDGARIATLEGLLVRRLTKEAMQPSAQELSPLFDSMYQVAWEERPELAPVAPSEASHGGRWLLFADRGGVGEALAEELRARGQDCQVVFQDAVSLGGREVALDPDQPALFHRLVRDYFGVPGVSYRNVVYLWGLDAPKTQDLDLDKLSAAERRASGSALLVSQAVAVVNSVTGASPRFWLVTRNAQGPAQAKTVELAQAPLWALGSAMARRYAELWGAMIDLEARDVAAPDADAQALLRELWRSDGEDQVALRAGKRFAPRLSRITSSEPTLHGPLFRADATYLVAGGLGQTGLRMAEWLANAGARHVVLVDLAELDEPKRGAVAALTTRSVDVRVVQADITRAADMAALFQSLTSLPPIKGIWHCAGSRRDDVFDLIQWRKFADATAPRVRGAWLLHEHSAAMELDHFAVLSSAVSWLGSETRTNEASAGAFLEALVRLRRAQGLPANIVHLGPLASPQAPPEPDTEGLEPLPSATAFEALDYLARRGVERAAVGKITWPALLQSYKGGAPPFYSLIGRGRTRRARQASEDPRVLRERIRKADEHERRPLLLEVVRQQVTDVLGADELVDPAVPLADFGLDSLISVNLVNRLEPVLGVSVPLAKLLQGATVERLVDDCLIALNASLAEAA